MRGAVSSTEATVTDKNMKKEILFYYLLLSKLHKGSCISWYLRVVLLAASHFSSSDMTWKRVMERCHIMKHATYKIKWKPKHILNSFVSMTLSVGPWMQGICWCWVIWLVFSISVHPEGVQWGSSVGIVKVFHARPTKGSHSTKNVCLRKLFGCMLDFIHLLVMSVAEIAKTC